jgi:CRISPR-associated protein Cas1
MHQILNTLYVMTQGAVLRVDHETLKVKVEGKVKLQVPLIHLGGICCFGRVMPTVGLIHRCALEGRAVVFFDPYGRFRARLVGPVSGNVLLRRSQHAALSDADRTLAIARNVVAGKIQNTRQVLLRARREADAPEDGCRLEEAGGLLAHALSRVEKAQDL